MLGLIWIQTDWHSDGIPEGIFLKILNFEKNQQTTSKAYEITQFARVKGISLTNIINLLFKHNRSTS